MQRGSKLVRKNKEMLVCISVYIFKIPFLLKTMYVQPLKFTFSPNCRCFGIYTQDIFLIENSAIFMGSFSTSQQYTPVACLWLYWGRHASVQRNGNCPDCSKEQLQIELSSWENSLLRTHHLPFWLKAASVLKASFHTLGNHYCSALRISSQARVDLPSCSYVRMKTKVGIIQQCCVQGSRMFSNYGVEPQNNFAAIKYTNVKFF